MKHLVVAIFTFFILLLMAYTYNEGPAFHGGEAGKIVEDIKSFEKKDNSFAQPVDNDDKDSLKSLKDNKLFNSPFAISN